MRDITRRLAAGMAASAVALACMTVTALGGCGRQEAPADAGQQGQDAGQGEEHGESQEAGQDAGQEGASDYGAQHVARQGERTARMLHVSDVFGRSDASLPISRVDGSWVHSDASDGTYVWVRDHASGAHYRVGLGGLDYAIVWDGRDGSGTLDYYGEPSAEIGRRVVMHLPADEYGRLDGEYAAAPDGDGGGDSALRRIAEIGAENRVRHGDGGDDGSDAGWDKADVGEGERPE